MLVVFGVATKPVNAAKNKCTTIQSGTLLNSAEVVITTGYDVWGYNYQANMFNGKYCDSYRDAAWCQPYKDDNLMMKWNNAWLSNQDCNGDGLLDRHFGYPSYIGSGAWLTNHQSGTYQSEISSGWDITGLWLAVHEYLGNTYPHNNNIVQASDSSLTGTGGWDGTQSGNAISTPNTWEIISGSVFGDTIHFDYRYTSVETCAVYGYVDAEINSDGSMTGRWTDDCGSGRTGSWSTSAGAAIGVYDRCLWNYFVKMVAVPSDAVKTAGVWYTVDGKEIGPDIWGEFATIQEVYNDSCTGEHGLMYKSPVRPGLGNWTD